MSGVDFVFQFDWDAREELEKRFNGATSVFGMCGDLNNLIYTAVVGLKRHHPDMTEEKLKEIAPPVVALQAAVMKALQYAYFGPKHPEEAAAEAEGTKKKAPLLKRFTRWLSKLALDRLTSGT